MKTGTLVGWCAVGVILSSIGFGIKKKIYEPLHDPKLLMQKEQEKGRHTQQFREIFGIEPCPNRAEGAELEEFRIKKCRVVIKNELLAEVADILILVDTRTWLWKSISATSDEKKIGNEASALGKDIVSKGALFRQHLSLVRQYGDPGNQYWTVESTLGDILKTERSYWTLIEDSLNQIDVP